MITSRCLCWSTCVLECWRALVASPAGCCCFAGTVNIGTTIGERKPLLQEINAATMSHEPTQWFHHITWIVFGRNRPPVTYIKHSSLTSICDGFFRCSETINRPLSCVCVCASYRLWLSPLISINSHHSYPLTNGIKRQQLLYINGTCVCARFYYCRCFIVCWLIWRPSGWWPDQLKCWNVSWYGL